MCRVPSLSLRQKMRSPLVRSHANRPRVLGESLFDLKRESRLCSVSKSTHEPSRQSGAIYLALATASYGD
jgi:hypothetical protein